MDEPAKDAPKTYIGFIWVDDQPGIRLSFLAHSPEEARAAVGAHYGKDHRLAVERR
jgi:hypothetical protein